MHANTTRRQQAERPRPPDRAEYARATMRTAAVRALMGGSDTPDGVQ